MDINCLKELQYQEGGQGILLSDLSGMDPQRQVGVDRMMAAGSLGVEMVSTLDWERCGFKFCSGLNIHIYRYIYICI